MCINNWRKIGGKNMKNLTVVLIIFAALMPFRMAAGDDCELLLTPLVDAQYTQIPPSSQAYLETKLSQMITQNGMGMGVRGGQFCLLAKCDILSKDVIGGAPIVQTQRLSFTLFIADMIDEKIISSTNIEVVSSGSSEAQTYINAIRRLNVRDRNIQEMIRTGKEKIMSFYNTNTDAIIKKAQNLATVNSHEEALFLLMSIPECSPKFDKVVAACAPIYQAYIDRACEQNLMAARACWAASPNANGAARAGAFLSNLEPLAKCYGDALTLYNEMKSSVGEDWKYEFKYYDPRALERERIDLQRDLIYAYRDVGVAFGNGQQPITTNILTRLR
jgi:hypothetical protein